MSVIGVVPVAHADLDLANASVADLRKELLALEEEQRDIATQKAAAEEKMKAAREQIALTRSQIDDQKVRLGSLETQLGQIALQQYQDRGVNTTVLLISSGSSEDLLDRMTMMRKVSDTANSLFNTLQLAQSTLADLERSEQAAIAAIKEEQNQIDALDEDSKAKVAQVSNLLNAMAAYSVAQSGGLWGPNGVGIGVVNPEELIPNPSAALAPVMKSYVMTSAFGMRIHPFSGGWSFHDGYDMAAPCGSPIYSAANGYVMDYYWAGSYGNRLVIDHGIIYGKHVVTSHNHIAGSAVSPGTSVVQGERIALVGSTGASTGCHDHYMIWMDGQIVDPTPYAGTPSGYGN
ncbi:MAG: peptidoglycan DD-metalloendopeptidase family protein [Propionibacteriaceae bacterium]|nr:peptidoglycan DD-metalloendopeptidase family protein [Propionibacteriaceae bacterium]